jgi:hypothetical protein
MAAGALIGGFAVSLLGSIVGALVGALLGALVGTRSWWLRCCQRCRSHWWRKDGGGSGVERHASELSEMGSMVSHVSSGGGDQYAEMANEQLLAERRRHEQEKEQLLQEKEKEQEQEKAELLARLEELQGRGAQEEEGAATAARSGRKDLYRTFDPDEGAA